MKALPRPIKLSKNEQIAMDRAIKDQILETSRKYDCDYEAMILWVLHRYYGFGKVRLLKFHDVLVKELRELQQYYDMDDVYYPARMYLKDLGVDVEKLHKESSDYD